MLIGSGCSNRSASDMHQRTLDFLSRCSQTKQFDLYNGNFCLLPCSVNFVLENKSLRAPLLVPILYLYMYVCLCICS